MTSLPASVLLRCFVRTYSVSGAYNPRGLQNIGFIHALDPGLAAIYGPGPELRAARLRYVRHYNSHPFWAPLILGLSLHMERLIKEGRIQPPASAEIKDTTINALSAIGDSVFSGSLRVTWILVSCALVLAGFPRSALVLAACLCILLQVLKAVCFWAGLHKGLGVLVTLRRYDLINLGDMVKTLNAALLALFLRLALPPGLPPLYAGAAIIFLLAIAWISGKMHFPRFTVPFIILALTLLPFGRIILQYLI